jgi:phosphoglycerate kinase
MLENLRFNPAEKSKDPIKRNEFGKHLANLADIYINDAFSVSHRDHASMTSIPKYIPGCIVLNLQHEIKTINDSLEQPERPFISIIGGVKADKLSAISNLLDKADKILVAGALGFTILKYFGNDVGKSKTDMDGLENFKDILAKIKDNPKVWLPTDAVISTNFSNDSKSSVVNCDAIPSESMALDIGPNTIKSYTKEILDAKTIIWNGPIGVFEFEKFANGTIEIAKAIGNNKNNNCVTIVGGGDSASAVNKLKLTESFTLVSSGGGASLKLFEGKTLIAIEVLKKFKD